MHSRADKNITMQDLLDIVSMDETDSIVLYDMDTRTVIAGEEDWLDSPENFVLI